MASLSLHNLRMDFIERNLFSNVCFDVEKGDKFGFIGANGVGKTTLFRIINGETDFSLAKNAWPGSHKQAMRYGHWQMTYAS